MLFNYSVLFKLNYSHKAQELLRAVQVGCSRATADGSAARRIPAVSPPTAFMAEKIQCRFKDRGCPFRTAHVPAQKQHEKTCPYQPRDTLQSQVLLTASPFGLQAQQRRAAQINDLAEQLRGDEESCTQAEIHLASYRSELAMRESGQFTELEIAEKLRADRQLRAGGTRTRAGGSRTDGRRENRTGGKKHRKVYSTDVKSRILHELDDLLHRMSTERWLSKFNMRVNFNFQGPRTKQLGLAEYVR